MISFILSSRNDKYGGVFKNINTTMRRLQLSLDSIYALGIENYEIIIVEWSPLDNEKRIKEEITINDKTKILTTPANAVKILEKEVSPLMPFYEYLAKHIGVHYSTNEILCICNPDNIFPKDGFFESLEAAKQGFFVRATRHEIERENLELSASEILEIAKQQKLKILRKFTGAGGDFMLLKKENYFNVGGYRLCHGNWDVDNEFQKRISKTMAVKYLYNHYHITHDFATSEAPGRPVGKAEQYKVFSTGAMDYLIKNTEL